MLPICFHDAYVAESVPDHHRFPMGKFRAVADRLIETGLVDGEDGFIRPAPAEARWLELAHDPAYVASVLDQTLDAAEQRRIGFKLSPSVALRSRCAVAGTILAARMALEHGAAANTAGGSHHADAEGGAGFCVFNDVAVAARLLLEEGLISRALVVDLDVHQGDGTARIFQADDRVFTFSAHCERNWPRRKARSDLDLGLDEGLDDAAYLAAIEPALDEAIAAARPDLVFYNAGVDPHAEDRLGLLGLSDQGLAARDRMVIGKVMGRGLPLIGVLGGGYSRDVAALARRHAYMHEALAEGFRRFI